MKAMTHIQLCYGDADNVISFHYALVGWWVFEWLQLYKKTLKMQPKVKFNLFHHLCREVMNSTAYQFAFM